MESEILTGRMNFVILGNTTDESKYAYKIKEALLKNGYSVVSIPADAESIDDVDMDIDLLDFCINPVKGLKLLSETQKNIAYAIIQPGAGSEDLERKLDEMGIPYVNGCVLRELEKDGRYTFDDSHNR